MKRCLSSLLVIGAFACASVRAPATTTEDHSDYHIRPLSVVTELPRTSWETLKFSFQRDSVPMWAGLIASTAVLYRYDSDLYDWAMGQGKRWNLRSEDMTKTIFSVGPYPVLRLPSDTGSALYFLGDGWTHFGIAGGFAAAGYFGGNTRAWNTSMEIVHGIVVSTIFNQFLKRTTGRESPNHRTSKLGTWRPFPNQMKYGQNTPKYDAFPSGHVMTATVVFNTIRMNYPEHDYWLLPLQAVWSSALMFQMMNNGVHWASDYPLGIAMGWAVAKVVHRQLGGKIAADGRTAANGWSFYPSVDDDGATLMNAIRRF